jgi:hypothetical protein
MDNLVTIYDGLGKLSADAFNAGIEAVDAEIDIQKLNADLQAELTRSIEASMGRFVGIPYSNKGFPLERFGFTSTLDPDDIFASVVNWLKSASAPTPEDIRIARRRAARRRQRLARRITRKAGV